MDGRDVEMERRMGTVDTTPPTLYGFDGVVQVRFGGQASFCLTCTLAHSYGLVMGGNMYERVIVRVSII